MCVSCLERPVAIKKSQSCKRCHERARRKAKPDLYRDYNRRYTRLYRYKQAYGITEQDYDAQFMAQGGLCAFCKRPPKAGSFLHVDHDHKTGAVRGLLCRGCNVGLGNFEDSPENLRAAAEYIENGGAWQDKNVNKEES